MKFKTLSVVSSLAMMAGMTAPAFAQDTTPVDETGRNTEIVVTAEFREARLQDTPIAITAVNAEMLEARGQTDISQVAAQAPNVSLRPQPQNGGSGLIAYIRGVGQTDFNYALDPGVGVYIDDVYIPTLSSSLLELIDLDRVEILRGPQGTLAGKNAIGGAIKLFSARPQGDNSGMMRIEYGSYNELVLRGMADFSISDDLAVRVSGMSRSRDGYVAMLDYGTTHPNSNVRGNNARGRGNADYESMGGQQVAAGRVALRWTPTDNLEVNVAADYTRENSEAIPTVLLAAGPPGANFTPNTNPNNTGLSVTSNGQALLRGKDGNPVPLSCRFVAAGPYSCDTGGNLLGYDPRFVSYSNFQDEIGSTVQSPFKPYFALPITEFEGWGVNGNLTYDLSDNVQFVYIGSYREYNSKFGQDQDASPLAIGQLDNELDHYAWSSEVRLNFEVADGFLDGTVGGFYLDQQGTYRARVDLNYVAPVIDFIHGPDTTPSTTQAVFGTLTLHPTENLSISGGLRYTEDQKDYTYRRSNPDGTLPNGFNCFVANGPTSEPNCLLAGLFEITGTFQGDRLDYRAVVDYRFSDSLLAYASLATGYKGGGVNPRPFVASQRLPFSPEELTTYEFGFKSDFADRRVRLNGAAFFNKYDNIILSKSRCPETTLEFPCFRPDNIGTADMWGLELEAQVYPVDGLSLDGSISYLNFEYTGASSGGFLVNSSIPVGGITPYTPEMSYSIGAQFDHETDSGTFSARLDGSYQGELFTSSENTVWSRVDGRFLANGRLTWTTVDDAWRVSLEVQNIFDKYYFTTVSDVTTSLGLVTGVPGLPRTWSLAVQRSF